MNITGHNNNPLAFYTTGLSPTVEAGHQSQFGGDGLQQETVGEVQLFQLGEGFQLCGDQGNPLTP